jgi:small conductance mechanosensitive channel
VGLLDTAGVLAQQGAEDELAEALGRLTVADWIFAAVLVVAGIVASRVVRAVTARVVKRGADSDWVVADLVGRVIGYVFLLGGFVYALAVLDVQLAPVLGALGLGGLAIAFAAQSILENFFSSIVLRARRPFRRGDQVSSGDFAGVVEEINFRTVVLRLFSGERVLIPCSRVLSEPIVNITVAGQRRTTVEVGVAYDTPLPLARDTLVAAVASVEGVRRQPPPAVWAEAFGESSIDFAVWFWSAPENAETWRVRSEVVLAIKAAFDDAGIEIPFPQRTVGFLPGANRMEVGAADAQSGD